MLDHHMFVRDPDGVLNSLKNRGIDAPMVARLRALVQRRGEAIQNAERLRQALNAASQNVQAQAHGGDKNAVEAVRAQLKVLKGDIKAAEDIQTEAEGALAEAFMSLPNIPHESVPVGQDEHSNRLERTVGAPPTFDFKPKAHWELVESLGIVNFEQAGKISGARFAVYRGDGARLERALIAYMLDLARDHGYTEIAPPLLVRREAMEGAGQYPKFIGESFETLESEFVLIPTSEVPLVNMHRDEILDEAQLPVRYAAYTPCFRREAGAAGKDTRGLIRQHQFNKVEMVAYTTPENSVAEHERLTANAEAVLKGLGLAYRVVSLCTGDLGFTSTKTYDLEVWLPGQDCYREISSCSNCGDFQARRARIRYRPASDDKKAKPRLVHTLNGSGVAVGRTFVAILENYQQADGSVRIPAALQPYFGAPVIAAR